MLALGRLPGGGLSLKLETPHRREGPEGCRPGPAELAVRKGHNAEWREQGKRAEEGRQGQGQEGHCIPGLYPRLEGASVGSVSLRHRVPHRPQSRAQHGL